MNNIEQIYTNCLAQGAYFIVSDGEAAVIDPLREPEPYLERAEKANVKIKYIFETHFHADFVSGHLELAERTGATIVYGPEAVTSFEKHMAIDGEEFKIGKITIKALHTPGHTPESTSYLLLDEAKKEKAIFTGDTLFIGDVGRPDLAQKATGLTQEDLAGWLFDSLRNKIMVLPDEVIVYPAHGQGSSCGKNMSSATWSTLGSQKENNYALRADMTKQEFIAEVTNGLQEPPQYFSKNAKLNKTGYNKYDDILSKGNVALDVKEFKTLASSEDVLVMDVRAQDEFVKGFIPGSWFFGLDGSFAPWVGTIVTDINQKILLVAPEGREEETIRRLARVGYDNTIGFLKGGIDSWKSAGLELETIESIDAKQFKEIQKEQANIHVLDARRPTEFATCHIVGAKNYPLDFIHENIDQFDTEELQYIHCRSGYRSTVLSSILASHGKTNLINIQSMFDELTENVACTNQTTDKLSVSQ